MKEKSESLERIGLALKHPVGIPPNVRILRRVGDKALFRQIVCEIAIRVTWAVGIDHRLRTSLQSVLADDDGMFPVFANAPFRDQQNAIRENVRIDVEHNLVCPDSGAIVEKPRAGLGGSETGGSGPMTSSQSRRR